MKIGNVVQISPNIRESVRGVVSSMLKYAGKIAIVTKVRDNVVNLDISRDDFDWNWDVLDLIPVNLSEGDIVKISNELEGKDGITDDMLKYADKTTKIISLSDNKVVLEINSDYVWHIENLITLNTTFQSGDKVQIISDLSVYEYGVTEKMLQYAGKTATIISQCDGYYRLSIDNSEWVWHPDVLTYNIITLDSLINSKEIVCSFVGGDREFLRSSILEVRTNRSAVKLTDWDKWIPVQQIHADAKTLSDKLSSGRVFYQSPYLGKIEILEWDPSEEYPLLIKTSDGDEFELTQEGKLFKDSQFSVL